MKGFAEIFGWKESDVQWNTVEEPTGDLRILKGVLQQRFCVKRFGNGILDSVKPVWRDVPSYNEEPYE